MYHELAKRDHHGIVVRLLWDSLHDRVLVTYHDTLTGDTFVADVPKAEALTAFHHPNAFRPSQVTAA